MEEFNFTDEEIELFKDFAVVAKNGSKSKKNKLTEAMLRSQMDKGNVVAYELLAVMYNFGAGGVKRDYKKAFVFYRLAADNGSDSAKESLADFLWKGKGCKKDINGAIKYLCDISDKDECIIDQLGQLYYEKGDYKSAIEWLEKGVEKGDYKCMATLAKIYLPDYNKFSTPAFYTHIFYQQPHLNFVYYYKLFHAFSFYLTH